MDKKLKELSLNLEVFEVNPQFIQYAIYNSVGETIGLLTLESPYNIEEVRKKSLLLS